VSQTTWGWTWVIVGTLLVAAGGLIATFGWDTIRGDRQRRNAIKGLARETTLNDRMVKEAAQLVLRWSRRVETDNFSLVTYRHTQVAAALTSGLLQPEAKGDRDLLQALDEYETAISRFNGALRIVGRHTPGIFIKPDLISADPKAWPENYRQAFAGPFQDLVDSHERTMNVLKERFDWALDIATPGS
jgi:hypothetical protein